MTTPTASPAPPQQSEIASNPPKMWVGFLLAFGAAVGYTLSNMALRQSARPGDIGWAVWITAHRAVPATIIGLIIILTKHFRNQPAFPPRNLVLPLIATGLVMQLGGNMMFQYALSVIGLAMSVPFTFATILISGATLSRFFLGESITSRTIIAMLFLIVAVTLLCFGAKAATKSVMEVADPMQMIWGVGAAMVAGTGYGIGGVSIRRNVKKLPVSATLILISSTGIVAMTMLTFLLNPAEKIWATTSNEYFMMQLAGCLNAAAFFSIGNSYRYLMVNQVNMINTTQIAMASLAGVVIFAEPLTIWLVLGIVLTMTGLTIMERK